jgi:hypothetical protein
MYRLGGVRSTDASTAVTSARPAPKGTPRLSMAASAARHLPNSRRNPAGVRHADTRLVLDPETVGYYSYQ